MLIILYCIVKPLWWRRKNNLAPSLLAHRRLHSLKKAWWKNCLSVKLKLGRKWLKSQRGIINSIRNFAFSWLTKSLHSLSAHNTYNVDEVNSKFVFFHRRGFFCLKLKTKVQLPAKSEWWFWFKCPTMHLIRWISIKNKFWKKQNSHVWIGFCFRSRKKARKGRYKVSFSMHQH